MIICLKDNTEKIPKIHYTNITPYLFKNHEAQFALSIKKDIDEALNYPHQNPISIIKVCILTKDSYVIEAH